ncbi:hypothetical protein [Burkholderia glumae]|uniref:hypothetical protein n=1 Tax=Burkholderia glumae TaxID=337 RepID=UPI002151530E|nr:hypothetical protein [Burkholderia glumae]
MNLHELEPRLENWARAQRSNGYTPARACSAESMYRGGGYREARAVPPAPDYRDASIVQAEWRRLMPVDKDILMMYYVWRAPSTFICRRLKLKQGRGFGHVWDFALFHAQEAIWKRLEKSTALVNPENSPYNPPRLLIPA